MTILDRILATKREEVAALKQSPGERRLRDAAAAAAAPRDFLAAVAAPGMSLIAEVKRASPSKGLIRADFDPLAIAKAYESGGARAISVLTDPSFFEGKLEYLAEVRAAVSLPVLRKDFLIDPLQLLEARAAGADTVLLIAECLPGGSLDEMHAAAMQLEMTPLVELYDAENIPRVLDCGARVIGVNNRDLRTFEVDLLHTVRLRREIPADRLVVGESGVFTPEDVATLAAGGVDAILVGESLMRQDDVAQAVRNMLSVPPRVGDAAAG